MSGCTFIGWNTAADWTGTDYTTGTFPITANMTLYAKWQLDTAPIAANLGFKYNNATLEVSTAALPAYSLLEIFIKAADPGETIPVTNEAKYTLDLSNSSNRAIGWHNVVGSSPPISTANYMWYRYIDGSAKSAWVDDGHPLGFRPEAYGTGAYDYVPVSSTSLTFNNTGSVYDGFELWAIRSGTWTSLGTISSVNQAFNNVQAGDILLLRNADGNYSYEAGVGYYKARVYYDGNGNTGGTAPTDPTVYAYGTSVTTQLNTGSLEKSGYTFAGWNTKADGTGTSYAAGTTFTIDRNTTLYAKW